MESKSICVGMKEMSIGKKRKVSAVEVSDERIEELEDKQKRIKNKVESAKEKAESSLDSTEYMQLLMDHSELLSGVISLQNFRREIIRVLEADAKLEAVKDA